MAASYCTSNCIVLWLRRSSLRRVFARLIPLHNEENNLSFVFILYYSYLRIFADCAQLKKNKNGMYLKKKKHVYVKKSLLGYLRPRELLIGDSCGKLYISNLCWVCQNSSQTLYPKSPTNMGAN